MTPQDHNKVIGIRHLIWGGFNALMMIILVPFFLLFMGIVGSDPSAPPEMKAVFGLMGAFVFVLTLWFLFGEGRHYQRAAAAAKENWRTPLHDATTFDRQAQRTANASRPREYAPPPQPPDWRGQ
jgi:Na+/melibiose symporter-like transporter